jgi:hypothetical protein
MRAARSACFSLATKETQIMQFQKGQSGNPAGRPRGSRNKTTVLMQNLLEGEAEAIARKAIEMAKDGDMAAIRVCMDRLASIRRKDPIAFELPPMDKARDTVAAVAAVVSAVAAGDLTTSEAAEVAKIIDLYVRALATTAFEERLEKLERAANMSAPEQRRRSMIPRSQRPVREATPVLGLLWSCYLSQASQRKAHKSGTNFEAACFSPVVYRKNRPTFGGGISLHEFTPLVPAKAGTQGHGLRLLDSRLRGNERW